MKLYRIKKSAIDKKGRGLYASKDIKAGTKVIDYIGKLITKKQTEMSNKYDNGKPKLFLKRSEGHEYSIDHYKNDFYIKTNINDAYNFKIMKTSKSNTKLSAWKDLVKHRENVLIEDMEIFDDYFVIVERNDGLMKVNIKSWNGKKDYYLPLESETYDLSLSTNLDFSSKISISSIKTFSLCFTKSFQAESFVLDLLVFMILKL
jgi:protease II